MGFWTCGGPLIPKKKSCLLQSLSKRFFTLFVRIRSLILQHFLESRDQARAQLSLTVL